MGLPILWLVMCFLPAIYARRLNRSGFAWFIISIILSPILGIIFLLIAGKLESDEEIKTKEINTQKSLNDELIDQLESTVTLLKSDLLNDQEAILRKKGFMDQLKNVAIVKPDSFLASIVKVNEGKLFTNEDLKEIKKLLKDEPIEELIAKVVPTGKVLFNGHELAFTYKWLEEKFHFYKEDVDALVEASSKKLHRILKKGGQVKFHVAEERSNVNTYKFVLEKSDWYYNAYKILHKIK